MYKTYFFWISSLNMIISSSRIILSSRLLTKADYWLKRLYFAMNACVWHLTHNWRPGQHSERLQITPCERWLWILEQIRMSWALRLSGLWLDNGRIPGLWLVSLGLSLVLTWRGRKLSWTELSWHSSAHFCHFCSILDFPNHCHTKWGRGAKLWPNSGLSLVKTGIKIPSHW